MAADEEGNDVGAVAVPVTGSIGVAPAGTAIPTPVEGADPDFTLDPAFQKLGLLKTDGGPQFAWAADGDPITFWQDGYTIPSGLANVTLVVSAAQTDDIVRSIVYGKTPDANGYLTVDGGGNSTVYEVFTEEIFKNGAIRRRVAANVTVGSVAEDQSTRGEVLGYQITFNIARSSQLENNHFGEWLLPPEVADITPPAETVSTSKTTKAAA
jgi:hypothetical protein